MQQELGNGHRFLEGPKFLKQGEDSWPVTPYLTCLTVAAVVVNPEDAIARVPEKPNPILVIVKHTSSIVKAKRLVASLSQIVQLWKSARLGKPRLPLLVRDVDLKSALNKIFNAVQGEVFEKE